MPDFLKKAARKTRQICHEDEVALAALFIRPRHGEQTKRLGAPGGALSKVDKLADKTLLLPLIEAFDATGRYQEIVPISAVQGTGTDDLVRIVAEHLPMGPRLFPEQMYTDQIGRAHV